MKWIIAFLGNPGCEYEKTRHNAGWIVAGGAYPDAPFQMNKYANAEIARIATSYFEIKSEINNLEEGDRTLIGCELILVKPHTFMNNSGDAIAYVAQKELIPSGNIIAVYDDIDIPIGKFKVSIGGGDANHNGVKSVVVRRGKNGFVRIRIGIGDPHRIQPLHGFVLGSFIDPEMYTISKLAPTVKEVIEMIVQQGAVMAQNKWNK